MFLLDWFFVFEVPCVLVFDSCFGSIHADLPKEKSVRRVCPVSKISRFWLNFAWLIFCHLHFRSYCTDFHDYLISLIDLKTLSALFMCSVALVPCHKTNKQIHKVTHIQMLFFYFRALLVHVYVSSAFVRLNLDSLIFLKLSAFMSNVYVLNVALGRSKCFKNNSQVPFEFAHCICHVYQFLFSLCFHHSCHFHHPYPCTIQMHQKLLKYKFN